MTHPVVERIHSPEELSKMISGMKAASHTFYAFAQKIGNHAFIEFAGLMNEYIKLCEKMVDEGKDFTCANTHVGMTLPFGWHNIDYLLEKLDCIYGPSITTLIKSGLVGRDSLPESTAERAKLRPAHFDAMSPADRWAIDKALGILDWDGEDDRARE